MRDAKATGQGFLGSDWVLVEVLGNWPSWPGRTRLRDTKVAGWGFHGVALGFERSPGELA